MYTGNRFQVRFFQIKAKNRTESDFQTLQQTLTTVGEKLPTKGPVGVDWKFAPVVIDQTPLLPHLTLPCGCPALTIYRRVAA